MKLAIVKVSSLSPYSQSRYYSKIAVPPGQNETNDDYARRTWREHCHYDPKTKQIIIPPLVWKNCLAEGAKFKPIRVPGRGSATYTKNFEAGVMVTEPSVLPLKLDQVESETLFLPSDGKRGGGKRVEKTYPVIREWSAAINFIILDELIVEKIFEATLNTAGNFVGIGRFRPRNNGYYGRFKIDNLDWQDAPGL